MRAPGWLVVLATAAGASVARADGPAALPVPSRGYVELAVRASDDAAAELKTSLRELLARLGLELHAAPSAPALAATAPDPLDRARVVVDESSVDHVDVVVTAQRDGRSAPSVTRTLPKGDSQAILTEQIAHVVHATLESLLETEAPSEAAPALAPAPAPAPARAATPEPAPAPAPDASPSPVAGGRLGLAAMLFAAGSGVATSSGAVFGGGGEARVGLGRGFGHPSFWIQGATGAAFAEQTSEVTVQTNVTSLRAGADVALVATRVFGLEAGAGAGADVFHTVPQGAGPRFALGPTMDLVDPMMTARVLAGVRIAGGVRAVAGIDLDFDLAAHHYVTVLASRAHDDVFQPWVARPTVILGVCVPLLGGAGCVP